MLVISDFSEIPCIRITIMISPTWQLMIILVRGSHVCKSQQPHDAQKCTHGLYKCAHQAPHNDATRRKNAIFKKTVPTVKCACQAAATRAHKVVPSGFRDCDFWWKSSDESKFCKTTIKKKTAIFREPAWHGATTTKNTVWEVIVLLHQNDIYVKMYGNFQTRTFRRGPPGSTMIFE